MSEEVEQIAFFPPGSQLDSKGKLCSNSIYFCYCSATSAIIIEKKTKKIKHIINDIKLQKNIKCVAITQGATYDFAIYYDREILIYDLLNDHFKLRLKNEAVECIEFNTSSKLLSLTSNGEIFYCDINETSMNDQPKQMTKIKSCNTVLVFKWYPFNTSEFAYGTTKAEIVLQSVLNPTKVSNNKVKLDDFGEVSDIAWYDVDENSKYILVASKDGDISLIDFGSNCVINKFEKYGKGILKVMFLTYEPGSFITIAKGIGRYIKWNVAKNTYQAVKKLGNDPIENCIISCESLLFTTDQGNVMIFDLKKEKFTFSLKGHHNQRIISMKFNPIQKELLATSSLDGTIKIWDVNTEKVIDTFYVSSGSNKVPQKEGKEKEELYVNSLEWSPSNKYLLITGEKELLRLWDISVKKVMCTLNLSKSKAGYVKNIVWDLENHKNIFCILGTKIFLVTYDSGLKVTKEIPFSFPVHSIALFRDSLIASTDNGIIKLYDKLTYSFHFELNGHKRNVICLSVNKVNQTFASSSEDFRIGIWSVNKKNLLGFLIGHTNNVTSLSWIEAKNILLSGSDDFTIRLWSVDKMLCVSVLTEYYSPVKALDSSYEHFFMFASTSFDSSIRFWNYNALSAKSLVQFDSDSGNVDLISKAGTLAKRYFSEKGIDKLFEMMKLGSPRNFINEFNKFEDSLCKQEAQIKDKKLSYLVRKEDIILSLIDKCAKAGKWETYCTLCMEVNRWEDALIASPNVSIGYYNYITNEYMNYCLKENKDEKFFAGLLSDRRDIVIQDLLSRDKYEDAKLVWITRNNSVNRKSSFESFKYSSSLIKGSTIIDGNSSGLLNNIMSNKNLVNLIKDSALHFISFGQPIVSCMYFQLVNDYRNTIKFLVKSLNFEIAYLIMKITKEKTYSEMIAEGLISKKKLSNDLILELLKEIDCEVVKFSMCKQNGIEPVCESEDPITNIMKNGTLEKAEELLITITDTFITNLLGKKIDESNLLETLKIISAIRVFKSSKGEIKTRIYITIMILECLNNNYKSVICLLTLFVCECQNRFKGDNDVKGVSIVVSYVNAYFQKNKRAELCLYYNINEEKIKSYLDSISSQCASEIQNFSFDGLREEYKKIPNNYINKFICEDEEGFFYYSKNESFPQNCNITESVPISSFSGKQAKNGKRIKIFNLTQSEYFEVSKYYNFNN